jgi:predicted DsbA family dithiol-disulfide isomerase
MRQCFCDACGQEKSENNLTTTNVNDFKVDLCYICQARLKTAQKKAEEEFMKTMKHQPFAFEYRCE